LSTVFTKETGSYLNRHTLFAIHSKRIPNAITVRNIEHEIKDVYYDSPGCSFIEATEFDDVFYFLYDDLMVQFDAFDDKAHILFRNTGIPKVEIVINSIKKFKIKKNRLPHISLLVNDDYKLETRAMTISKPKLNIENNYKDDFKEVHQIILKRLSKYNNEGIVLLYGKPGTGKTSYAHCLASKIKREVILLTPNMAYALTSPDLIPALINNANSILIIEDVENIVIDRNTNEDSSVSSLLNISDEPISACLSIQIICTCNTDISRADNALLRKGRRISQYEFKELIPKKRSAFLIV